MPSSLALSRRIRSFVPSLSDRQVRLCCEFARFILGEWTRAVALRFDYEGRISLTYEGFQYGCVGCASSRSEYRCCLSALIAAGLVSVPWNWRFSRAVWARPTDALIALRCPISEGARA